MTRVCRRVVRLVGLVGWFGAGSCRNLPQRRPAAGAARRRNVHFALESAVPTVVLECKMHHSRAKCTSRRAEDRRSRPGHRRRRPRPGASPVIRREGAQRSLSHRKQWPGGRDRRDPGPAQTRARLAQCEPSATKSASARTMRAQRDKIRLRSIRASPPRTMRSQVTSPKRLPPGRARAASSREGRGPHAPWEGVRSSAPWLPVPCVRTGSQPRRGATVEVAPPRDR